MPVQDHLREGIYKGQALNIEKRMWYMIRWDLQHYPVASRKISRTGNGHVRLKKPVTEGQTTYPMIKLLLSMFLRSTLTP